MHINNSLDLACQSVEALLRLHRQEHIDLHTVCRGANGNLISEIVTSQLLENAEYLFNLLDDRGLYATEKKGSIHHFTWINQGDLSKEELDGHFARLQENAAEGVTYQFSSMENNPDLANVRASLSQYLAFKRKEAAMQELLKTEPSTQHEGDTSDDDQPLNLKQTLQAESSTTSPLLLKNHKEAMKAIAKASGITIGQVLVEITEIIIAEAYKTAHISKMRQEEKNAHAEKKEKRAIAKSEARVETRTQETTRLEEKLGTIRNNIQRLLKRLMKIEVKKEKVHLSFRQPAQGEPPVNDLVVSLKATITSFAAPVA